MNKKLDKNNKNIEIKNLLRNTENFNPTLRTFSNFESGLKFQKLLYTTKFLVPLISNKKHIGGKMLYVTNEYKTKFYLIFTDFTEINNCFKKEKYQYLETTLDKVSKLALKNNALILLNWKSDNYILNQETLKSLFNKENLKPVTFKNTPLYTQAENYFPHFTNTLTNYFKNIDTIKKVYFLNSNTIKNNYLLLIDTPKDTLQEISQEVKKLLRKEKIDINLTISNRINPFLHYSEFYSKESSINTSTELHA